MLKFGFLGEVKRIHPTLGFIVGMVGWIYIIYEVFAEGITRQSQKPHSNFKVKVYPKFLYQNYEH